MSRPTVLIEKLPIQDKRYSLARKDCISTNLFSHLPNINGVYWHSLYGIGTNRLLAEYVRILDPPLLGGRFSKDSRFYSEPRISFLFWSETFKRIRLYNGNSCFQAIFNMSECKANGLSELSMDVCTRNGEAIAWYVGFDWWILAASVLSWISLLIFIIVF